MSKKYMNISVCGIDCDACSYKKENKCEGCRIVAPKGKCVGEGGAIFTIALRKRDCLIAANAKIFRVRNLKNGLHRKILSALIILEI
jgi:hypothetical protein